MKTNTILLGIASVALMAIGAAAVRGQTSQQFAQAAKMNAVALRRYEWKQRTEIQREGETKSVQVALIGYGSDGQMTKTPVSSTPEPDLPKFGLRKAIAQKKFKEFRETVHDLGILARSYSELSPEKMQRFMATASPTHEILMNEKVVRLDGQNVLNTGDSMSVWISTTSGKQRRIEIHTSLDGKLVRIVSEFKDIPHGGPTYLALSRVSNANDSIAIITENFEHRITQTSSTQQ